jgi:hypothetical protein
MSWNYRIVRYADGSGYGLHEVYYDKDGKERSMTADPIDFTGESPEEIRGSMLMAKVDVVKRPVFDEPAGWTKTKRRNRKAGPR